jgi:hypothetical protein
VLIAVGSHKPLAGVWLAEAVANLAASVVLVRHMGLVGVALGTLAPVVWGHLGVMLPRACRAVALPVRRCLAETLRPALVGGTVAALVCALLRLTLPPASTRGVLAEAAFTGASYCVAVYGLGFSRAVRASYEGRALSILRDARRAVRFTRPARVEIET